ncbi:M13 family metallopeptidase [Thalassotalea mangrovi]|nr:M13 family metallopeptidase [Thalassotalea mangrovi]
MVKYLISTFLLLTLLACTSGSRQATPVSYRSGIDLENMLLEESPGKNFHQYVNGHWQQYGVLPSELHQYDVFDELEQRSHDAILQIIERAARTRYGHGTDEQKVGDLYQSFLDFKRRNSMGIAPLKPVLEQINAIESNADFARYLAFANKADYNPPFALSVEIDLEDTSRYMLTTWQAGLGLPDKQHYLSDEQKYRDIRGAYRQHIVSMFELAGIEDAELNASKVIALETELANHHEDKPDNRDKNKLYNKFLYHNLPQIMPYFDWKEFVEDAGLSKNVELVVPQIDYLRGLNEMLVTTELEDWKLYFTWHAIHANANHLTQSFARQHFAFYGKTLNQQRAMRSAKWRAVNVVNDVLGDIVGKTYLKEHLTTQVSRSVQQIVRNQVFALAYWLDDIDWLDGDTLDMALDKLAEMQVQVGGPTIWQDYQNLEIRFDDYFGNQQRAAIFQYQQQLMLLNQDVDRERWQQLPQSVHVTYQPELNQLIIPTGAMQPPLYDPGADQAINYGAMGSVIAEALIASIDNNGRNFDDEGIYQPWWQNRDKREYLQLAANVAGQYDTLALSIEHETQLHAHALLAKAEAEAEAKALAAAKLLEEIDEENSSEQPKDGVGSDARDDENMEAPETETLPESNQSESLSQPENMPAPVNEEFPPINSSEEINTELTANVPDGSVPVEQQGSEESTDSSYDSSDGGSEQTNLPAPQFPMVNGVQTLDRSLSDINSLSVALRGYQRALSGRNGTSIDGFTGLQRFFIGYAQRWRTLYSPQRLEQMQQQEDYLPLRYRVNGAVRNMDAFYRAFDIQEDERMFLPAEQRVRIW